MREGLGRTTSMLEEAIAAAERGEEVIVVAHTVAFAEQLRTKTSEMIRIARQTHKVYRDHILFEGGNRMRFMGADQEARLRGSTAQVFYDHNVWERR